MWREKKQPKTTGSIPQFSPALAPPPCPSVPSSPRPANSNFIDYDRRILPLGVLGTDVTNRNSCGT